MMPRIIAATLGRRGRGGSYTVEVTTAMNTYAHVSNTSSKESTPKRTYHGHIPSTNTTNKAQVEAFARDPLLNRLLADKWDGFARNMYLRRRLVPNLALVACFVALLVVRCA